MACVNQKRQHCVNQMGKTQSKPSAACMAGKLHGMCELALTAIPTRSGIADTLQNATDSAKFPLFPNSLSPKAQAVITTASSSDYKQ
jgi:hypothetical protein